MPITADVSAFFGLGCPLLLIAETTWITGQIITLITKIDAVGLNLQPEPG